MHDVYHLGSAVFSAWYRRCHVETQSSHRRGARSTRLFGDPSVLSVPAWRSQSSGPSLCPFVLSWPSWLGWKLYGLLPPPWSTMPVGLQPCPRCETLCVVPQGGYVIAMIFLIPTRIYYWLYLLQCIVSTRSRSSTVVHRVQVHVLVRVLGLVLLVVVCTMQLYMY
jgi:hypothetical protein